MKGSGAVAELQILAKHTSNNEMFIATLVALNQINGPSDVQFGSNQYEVLKELFDGESTEEIAAISHASKNGRVHSRRNSRRNWRWSLICPVPATK